MAQEQSGGTDARAPGTDPTQGATLPAIRHDFDDDPWENPAVCLRLCLEEILVVSDHPNRLAIAAHAGSSFSSIPCCSMRNELRVAERPLTCLVIPLTMQLITGFVERGSRSGVAIGVAIVAGRTWHGGGPMTISLTSGADGLSVGLPGLTSSGLFSRRRTWELPL
jgi:hypothetical protein